MEFQTALAQFLAGGIGGLVRGLVGITKSQTFDPKKFYFPMEIFCRYSCGFYDCWSVCGSGF